MPMSLISANKILDYLDSTIICMNSNLQIKQVNATAEVFFDTSESVLLDKKFSDLLSKKEANSIQSSLEFSAANNHQVTEHEAVLTLSNGKLISCDYSIHPIIELDSLNLLLEIRPLDRHLEIAQEGQRIAQQLASQQLARGMAHEIKNPLGGIRGAAQLLEREINNPELKEYTDVIIHEVDRLQVLLNSMLGPNRRIAKAPVNILEVLEHVSSVVLAEFTHNLEIIRDYDPSLPDIYADKNQLIQAFLNIVRNAAQSVADQERGTITLRTRVSRQHTILNKRHKLVMQIDVIDNGPGISPELIENIFLPMVTDKADGSGLGLPIAQQIITGHEGIIQCNSSSGSTEFNTLLPLEAEHE
jgi:two-component system, NtrC family, nitrogen regulation sensor histidine kinase GlnL